MKDKTYKARITIKGGNEKGDHLFFDDVVTWQTVGKVLQVIALQKHEQ